MIYLTPTPTPTPSHPSDDPSGDSSDEGGLFSGHWWLNEFLPDAVMIFSVLVAGLVLKYVIHKLIQRLERRVEEEPPPDEVLGSRHAAQVVFGSAGVYSERRVQRAKTLGSMAESIATVVIWAVVILIVLDVLGYNIGPLIASAGIAGVALGFGAQSLVQDFLSGIFMLFEDQYGVGDYVDLGEASGTIEEVGLRVTRLRDVHGTVWYIRNGEVARTGNYSQDWARAVIDVGVAYDEVPSRVKDVLLQVANELAADPEWEAKILEEPELWGVQELAADSVVVRLVLKTEPLEQWAVAREMRERIKARFDAEGIVIPFPQRTVWMHNE